MQIVIEIPTKRYKDIQRIAEVQLESKRFQTAEQIIAKGIPLPKGHGRLIDADALNRKDVNCANVPMNFIDTAPTIIEADTEGSESE